MNTETKTRKFYAAIETLSQDGILYTDNLEFETHGPVSVELLDSVKTAHCKRMLEKGAECTVDRTVILAIIPIE